MFGSNEQNLPAKTKIIGIENFGMKMVNYSIDNMISNVEFVSYLLKMKLC